MRNAFADEVYKLAEVNNKVFLNCADIGNRLFDKYKEKFPNRFLNCGIAEANMISMACGMALRGLKPITYTITPFITARVLEQIRVDICYHNVPVIIIGVGAGLSYYNLGPTHHSCEDIAMLRALPNIAIICPADAFEVRAALRASLMHNGPVYIRLGKKNEPLIHKQTPNLIIGQVITIKEGNDVCLLSTGNMLPTTMEAAKIIEKEGVSVKVVSFHTVKPLDENFLSEAFSKFKVITSIEEHSLIGGLGSSIAEWLCDREIKKGCLVRIGTPDKFFHDAGSQDYARKILNLTPEKIATKTLEKYKKVD